MPDIEIILICAAPVIIAILTGVLTFIFAKHRSKKRKEKSKFNYIHSGMTEKDLYSQFGTPKKTFAVDSTSKVVTFTEKKWGLITVETIVAQVSIKDGVVTNIEICNEAP